MNQAAPGHRACRRVRAGPPEVQWVAAAVAAEPGELVADLCVVPGGKAMVLAASGATVVAADILLWGTCQPDPCERS